MVGEYKGYYPINMGRSSLTFKVYLSNQRAVVFYSQFYFLYLYLAGL